MDLRALRGMLACWVLVAHTAALGHAHPGGAPAGHDLRPHLHRFGHAHPAADEAKAGPEHPQPHRHSHSHPHPHPAHGAAADHVQAPAEQEDAPGAGWRRPSEHHDHDALYLATAAQGLDPARKASTGAPDFDLRVESFPTFPLELDFDAAGGSVRFRRPPRDGCALLALFVQHHAFRC